MDAMDWTGFYLWTVWIGYLFCSMIWLPFVIDREKHEKKEIELLENILSELRKGG